MKVYLICSAVMMFAFLFRCYAEIVEYKRSHPGIKFQKTSFAKSIVSLVQVCVYFLIPLLNVFLFGVALFGPDEVYRKAIEEKVLR